MSTYKYDYKKFGAILKDVLAGKTQREVAKTHKCSFTTISKAKVWHLTGRRVEYKKLRKYRRLTEVSYFEKSHGCLCYIAQVLEVKNIDKMSMDQLKKAICESINKF